jgi:hypothetical protein
LPFIVWFLSIEPDSLFKWHSFRHLDQWDEVIRQFEANDRTTPPEMGGLLLVGSSSFRMWQSAANDLPEKTVINRGFGGSQMSDLLY